MAQTVKNFSFNVDLESWAANAGGGTGITQARDTAEDATNDTNAGTGILQTNRAGKNRTNGAPYWEWGNGTLTWESLGVPAGATVTAVDLDYDWRCSTYTTGSNTSSTGPAELRNNDGTVVRGTFSAALTFGATSAWATRGGTELTGLSDASNTAIRLRVGANPKTGNSTSASVTLRQDWIVVTITYTAISPTRGQVSWAEAEVPFVGTRGRVSFAEVEVPAAPTRGRVSWAEQEVPSPPADPTRGLISWAEGEVPIALTRGRITWAEVEVPLSPTRGRVSWGELEAPFTATRGRTSQAEFEVPLTPTRGRVAWAELETPIVLTRGRLSWAEMEAPTIPTMGRMSWTELEVPPIATRGLIAWTEFSVGGNEPKYPQSSVVGVSPNVGLSL